MRRRTAGWLVIAGLLTRTPVAQAETDAEPFHVVYRASDNCPDQAAFVRLVRARTRRARLAQTGERGRTFLVTLLRSGASLHGSLAIVEESGVTDTRELDAKDCEEAVRALSLIAALAMDPNAGGPAAEPSPEPPPDRARPERPRPALASRRASRDEPRQPSPTERRSSVVTGVRLEVEGAIAPFPTLVPSLFVATDLLGSNVWIALTLGAGQREIEVEGVALAKLGYLGGRADLCASMRHGPWRAGPCVGLQAGAVRARGFNLAGSDLLRYEADRSSAWIEPVITLMGAWRPVDWLEVTALGGAGFPLRSTEYFFRNRAEEVSAYEVPLAAAIVGLGAGIVLR